MIDALIGAVAGGLMAIAGGFWAQRTQNNHAARVVARAILIELRAPVTDDEYVEATDFYNTILDDMMRTGEVPDSEAILRIFSISPQERYPIYYANSASVGTLPVNVSEAVVRFHALSAGLVEAGKLLLTMDFEPDQLRATAFSVKRRFADLLQIRAKAIAALEFHVNGIPSQLLAPKPPNFRG